jgi:hypothetical protein
MRVRGLACVIAGGVALAVPSLAFGATMIGEYDQSGDQGVNSTQAGILTPGGPGYSARGVKFVSGTSKSSESQDSVNVAVGIEAITPGETGGAIGNGSQRDVQGIDSAQGAKKGHQHSTNVEVSGEVIAPQDGDAIIGTTGQASDQGEKSNQLLAGGQSGGVLLTEATGGATNQNSTNAEISAQVILG